MAFEFDPAKSRANKRKHGIDFVEAQALWDDAEAIEIATNTNVEPRFVVAGMIEGKLWTAIVTYRNDNIRLISVRRAWKKEIDSYEKNKGKKD